MTATESAEAQATELDKTPTMAAAVGSAVMIIICIVLEKVLERVGEWLTEKHKKALFEALMKVKSELMILGSISLLLTFGQSYIARRCLPAKIINNIIRTGRDFFRLPESKRLKSYSDDRTKTTRLSTSFNVKIGQVSNPPSFRKRIGRRRWVRPFLVLSLLFLSAHSACGEQSGGEPGDGGGAGDKGGVSGGPPGGDTDVGSAAPSPPGTDGGLDSTPPPPSAWGEHSGGDSGDGGGAGDKGSVSGGPPGGDTDVGAAPPSPAGTEGEIDSTAPPPSAWAKHSEGKSGDGGGASAKGGVSGGQPGGDTIVGAAAPSPTEADGGIDSRAPAPILRL